MPSIRQDRILNGAIPVMRDYIVRTWWATRQPVQASKGDAKVRRHAGLGPKSNPAGWWGRAWTAVEACRRGETPHDNWMVRFEPWFRGLSRVSNRQPYLYLVEDPSECPPPEFQFKRAVETLADAAEGRLVGVEERRAVEEAGMRAARQWLRDQGFSDEQIKDTSATESWDFETERDGTKWYVEAKGSVSPWSDSPSIVVTRNEVLHAQEYGDSTTVVIAASCKLSRGDDGRLLATPGEVLVISPWRP
jgi:hypothetical protein